MEGWNARNKHFSTQKESPNVFCKFLQILQMLFESTGNLLDDEKLIE